MTDIKSSPSVIRKAVSDDEGELWRLFRLHHEENALFPLSDRKVQFYLDRVLRPENIAPEDSGPRGVVGVIGPVGALEGAIMLVLGSPWYTEQITVDDCMNFVDPEHRKSGHAKALIDYSVRIVDSIRDCGHPDFRMILGVVSTKRTAAKINLYSRKLTLLGAYFVHPPIDGAMPLTIKNGTK